MTKYIVLYRYIYNNVTTDWEMYPELLDSPENAKITKGHLVDLQTEVIEYRLPD